MCILCSTHKHTQSDRVFLYLKFRKIAELQYFASIGNIFCYCSIVASKINKATQSNHVHSKFIIRMKMTLKIQVFFWQVSKLQGLSFYSVSLEYVWITVWWNLVNWRNPNHPSNQPNFFKNAHNDTDTKKTP